MKRLASIAGGAITAVVVFATPVLAQYPPYPPQPAGGGSGGDPGAGGGASGGGDLAFTGADITLWMILAAILIVAGVVAVLAGRRPVAES